MVVTMKPRCLSAWYASVSFSSYGLVWCFVAQNVAEYSYSSGLWGHLAACVAACAAEQDVSAAPADCSAVCAVASAEGGEEEESLWFVC